MLNSTAGYWSWCALLSVITQSGKGQAYQRPWLLPVMRHPLPRPVRCQTLMMRIHRAAAVAGMVPNGPHFHRAHRQLDHPPRPRRRFFTLNTSRGGHHLSRGRNPCQSSLHQNSLSLRKNQ